jgi:hypothetical protein
MPPDDEGQLEDLRDLRIRQLQGALDSRVAIEQAKGMLAERFGLGLDDAFDLLRHAARSSGTKLTGLATEVVSSRRTPVSISEALARVGHGPDHGFARRASIAEQTVADLNDALADLHASTSWSTFACECSNPLCAEEIELTSEILERVHANRGHYVVKPGHEVDDVEETVAAVGELLVVRKHVAA